MSDSAGTKKCESCLGTGDWPLPDGDSQPCGRCSGTGLDTAGAVVGMLDGPRATVTVESLRVLMEDAQNGDHVAIAALAGSGFCHTEFLLEVVEGRDATIAAQAAEIERLKGDNEELRIQRDTAIEAREELRERLDRCKKQLDARDELAWKSGMRTVPPADEEAAATYRNPHDPEALRKRIADLEGKHGWQWYERKLSEANARAESYLSVIEALRLELAGVMHCHAATIRSIVRLANAGLELPEVNGDE